MVNASGWFQLWDCAPVHSNLPPRRLLGKILRYAFDAEGRRVVTPEERGALVCVEFDDPAAVVAHLQKQGVITSWRDGSVRFSFHFYNDERDVEAALAALETV